MMLHTKYQGSNISLMVSDNKIFLGVDYSISIYSSIDIDNAYICIQNSIGMFQVGV